MKALFLGSSPRLMSGKRFVLTPSKDCSLPSPSTDGTIHCREEVEYVLLSPWGHCHPEQRTWGPILPPFTFFCTDRLCSTGSGIHHLCWPSLHPLNGGMSSANVPVFMHVISQFLQRLPRINKAQSSRSCMKPPPSTAHTAVLSKSMVVAALQVADTLRFCWREELWHTPKSSSERLDWGNSLQGRSLRVGPKAPCTAGLLLT